MILKIKRKTLFLIITFFILLFFSGFRYDVGVDWASYYNYFGKDFWAMTERYHTKEMEPLNILLKEILMLYGMENGSYWIWAMAVITLFFTFSGIYFLSKDCKISILLYISMGFFFFTLNGIRQHCAVAISFFSILFIQNRRFFPFLITIIIAFGFHYTAIIMLPLYFLANKIFSKYLYLILILAAIPISFILNSIISMLAPLLGIYSVYADSEYAMSNGNILSNLKIIFPLFLFGVIYKYYNKLIANKEERILLNISILSLILSILFPGVLLGNRINCYFQLVLIAFIPLITSILPYRYKQLFIIVCVIYNITLCYITLFSRPDVKIIPYNLNFDILGISLFTLTIFLLLFLLCYLFLLVKPLK